MSLDEQCFQSIVKNHGMKERKGWGRRSEATDFLLVILYALTDWQRMIFALRSNYTTSLIG